MVELISFIGWLLYLYSYVIIAAALISWVSPDPRTPIVQVLRQITEPVLIHHGTLDESCPIAWSHTTQRLLRRAGVDSRLEVYRGEQHAFGPQWPLSMERTVRFLRHKLRG